MDRHKDWAVIVCLVGGGQEIHTGESGIGAWLDAVRDKYPHWHTYISPELHDSEYAAGKSIERLGSHAHVETQYALHLAVSMRSFRAQKVSGFVKAALDADEDKARELLTEVLKTYSVVLTRDRTLAKKWVREQARGNERYGLVASSQAQRLKAYCIDVRVDVDPVKYFRRSRRHPLVVLPRGCRDRIPDAGARARLDDDELGCRPAPDQWSLVVSQFPR